MQLQHSFAVIALFINFDVIVDLITVTTLSITCFFKVSNKHFKCTACIRHAIKQIMFGTFTVTTCNFFVITIHNVNVFNVGRINSVAF